MTHKPDSEQALLSCLMQDINICDEIIPKLTDDHFFLGIHKAIFQAIKSLHEKGHGIDMVSVSEACKVAPAEVSQIASRVPSTANATTYYNSVVEAWKRRKVIGLSAEIQEEAKEGDIDEVIEKAENELGQIAEGNEEIYDLADLILEAEKINEMPYDTGLGKLPKQELIIIGGRPSQGKTALALSMMLKLIRDDVPCVFFSLEMGLRSLGHRILSMKSGIKHERIKYNDVLNVEEQELMNHIKGELRSSPLTILDRSNPTIHEIRSEVNKLHREGKCEIVFIDYLQYVKVTNKDSHVRGIGDITREAKRMAKELNIPVVLLSQLSRDSEKRMNKRPTLSDLRDSGEIEQDADIAMFIHRPYYYDDTQDENRAELITAKNRNGATGIQEISFNADCVKFESLWKY
jgi:replicative DNA helicase